MRVLYITLAILVWFLTGAVISHLARKRLGGGFLEYFLASRGVGGFISAMTYSATTYSAFMMVGLVGMTYLTGIASLGFELLYLIATVALLTIFGPRFWIAGKRYKYVTPSEMLGKRYGSKNVAVLATVLCLLMLIPYSSIQLKGIGYLLEVLSDGAITYLTGTLIAAVISFIFIWWAGLRSVALTDALQATIMLIASLVLLSFVIVHFFGSPDGFVQEIEIQNPASLQVSWSFPMFLGLTLPWMFFAITNPQVSQRLFIPRDKGSLRKMVVGFSIFGFIYTIICAILGIASSTIHPGLSVRDQAMPTLLTHVPEIIALVILVGITAAAISTINSIVLTLSSMFSRDIYGAHRREEEKELLVGKLIIPLILVVCFIFAQFEWKSIVVLSTMSSGGLLMLLPTILGTFFWKRGTASGALASIGFGGLITGGLYIMDIKPFGQWPPVWGILVATALFVSISLITEPPKEAEFVDKIREEMKKF